MRRMRFDGHCQGGHDRGFRFCGRLKRGIGAAAAEKRSERPMS